MSSRESVNILSPNNKEEECAKFNITSVSVPFSFKNTTKTGDEYTFSAWIKASLNSSITIEGIEIPVTTEWQRHKATFVENDDILKIFFNKRGTYYFYKSQLELGNVMTDWKPSSEDADAEMAELYSKIEATAEAISLEVSKTYETKSDATNQYNTLNSKIATTAESITSSVSKTYETKSNASTQYSNLSSQIVQSANNITSSVSQTYETKTDSQTKYSNLSTTITQTARDWSIQLEGVESVAENASKTATNYLNFSGAGLVVGNMTGKLGNNVLIGTTGVNIRNGTTNLATFAKDKISLGINSTSSIISLCNGEGELRRWTDSNFAVIGKSGLNLMVGNSTEVSISSSGTTIYNDVEINGELSVSGGGFTVSGESTFTLEAVMKDGLKVTGGNIYSKNNITTDSAIHAGGQIHAGASIYIGSGTGYSNSRAVYMPYADSSDHAIVYRSDDGLTSYFGWAGDSSYATVGVLRGRTVKYQNSSGTTTLSDERLKKDFSDLEKWEGFYNAIEPCAFRMKNGASGRYHVGFKAQQIEQALCNNGLTTNDFAGFIRMPYKPDPEDPEGSKAYKEAGIEAGADELGLIYSEFIAMNTYQIQQLKKELLNIKNEVNNIKLQAS